MDKKIETNVSNVVKGLVFQVTIRERRAKRKPP